MEVKSQVKTLPPGAPVRLGRNISPGAQERITPSFPLVTPTAFAVIKRGAKVIVGGAGVSVVGRVCMGQINGQCGDMGEVKMGDEVIFDR